MKKENNGIYLFIIIIFIVIFSFWVKKGNTNKNTYKVESINFINGPVLLATDETYKTNIIFNPISGNEKIIYYVENPDIASVDKYGNVTAKKEGSTYLIAKLKNGIQDNIEIIVNNSNNNQVLEKLSIDEYNVKLNKGEKHQIKYTVMPSILNTDVIWYSSNPSIVSVDNGVITANEIGSAVVTLYYNNQFYDNIDVTVNSSYIELVSIQIEPSSLKLYSGNSYNLKLNYYPNNATNQNVTWSSSNPSIVSVDNGIVVAKGKGTATIKAKVLDKEAISIITVSEFSTVINVEKVKLNKESLVLDVGSKEKIEAEVIPNNASDKTLIWKSSNEKIFKVFNNTIEGVGVGEAVLSVTSTNNKTAYLKVKVTKKEIEASSISLNVENIYLDLNQTFELKYSILPINTTNKNVSWYTGSKEVVSVDNNGLITALKYGKTTISVLTSNGKLDKVTVYVVSSNKDFKYGEELNGTNNYCLYGGNSYNGKKNLSDLNNGLSSYINTSKQLAYLNNENEKRVMVAASAYFLINNQICKIKYMSPSNENYITKGWYKGWTISNGINVFSLIKWSYYQVFDKTYSDEILGKYISAYNKNGLYLKDILDKAKIGDILINKTDNVTEFALIINVDKSKKRITLINDKNNEFDIVTIGYNNYTGYNTLTNMERIFK